jgi:hypothetical protein
VDRKVKNETNPNSEKFLEVFLIGDDLLDLMSKLQSEGRFHQVGHFEAKLL